MTALARIQTGQHAIAVDDLGDGRLTLSIGPDEHGPRALDAITVVLDPSHQDQLAAAVTGTRRALAGRTEGR